jgi:small multidrug resistance pump
MHYIYLALAICSEVVATSTLKNTENFTRLWPSLLTGAGYMAAFYFLSLCLQSIPVGVAYAIWSGLGIVSIALVDAFYHGQHFDVAGVIGVALIVAGCLVLLVLSDVKVR